MADDILDNEKVFQIFRDEKTGELSSRLLLVVTVAHPHIGSIPPSKVREMVGQAIAVIFSASEDEVLQETDITMSFVKGIVPLTN